MIGSPSSSSRPSWSSTVSAIAARLDASCRTTSTSCSAILPGRAAWNNHRFVEALHCAGGEWVAARTHRRVLATRLLGSFHPERRALLGDGELYRSQSGQSRPGRRTSSMALGQCSMAMKTRHRSGALPQRVVARDMPHAGRAGAFDVDRAALLAGEVVLHQAPGAFGDLDGAGLALAFHSAREVHRVAPQVVDELLGADHARHHRP